MGARPLGLPLAPSQQRGSSCWLAAAPRTPAALSARAAATSPPLSSLALPKVGAARASAPAPAPSVASAASGCPYIRDFAESYE